MISQSTQIIRDLAGPDVTIFNDKLSDGSRSYKVWGWKKADAEHAQKVLTKAGFKAVIKQTRPREVMRGYYTSAKFRIHVK